MFAAISLKACEDVNEPITSRAVTGGNLSLGYYIQRWCRAT